MKAHIKFYKNRNTRKTTQNMKKIKLLNFLICVGLLTVSSCATRTSTTTTISGLNPERFDTVINEKPVKLYTLKNKTGMEVCITNFGGRVVSISVPDKNGKATDVVLGFDNIAQYADSVNNPSDFGAAIGRYANRIDQGIITIANKKIQLPKNNFGHCLHGGNSGWQYQIYDANQPNDSILELTLLSKDGDNNFPGNVTAKVTYWVKSDNSLDISYTATTDKETVINMTNHSYFNLNGNPETSIENCLLYINADNFTPTDTTFMTTGEIRSVEGTPMDFRTAAPIGKDVNNFKDGQVKNGNGFDHNWCLNTYKDGKGDDTAIAASLYSPLTGINLDVYTNEPGIQVYTGNFLEGKLEGKNGIAYKKHAACCLETQKYPDSPNKKEWPSPYIKPGEKYYSHCVFKFSIK